MRQTILGILLLVAALATGCATSQNVTLAQLNGARPLSTVAMIPSDGNSADMDEAIRSALLNQGLTPKPPLPAGTRKSSDVDLIVSYTDQWRWDLVMYLRWVSIDMYDAETGNLLATARWDNSAFHGFQDYKTVVKGLVDEMMVKIRAKG
jgi:hypothetical protein